MKAIFTKEKDNTTVTAYIGSGHAIECLHSTNLDELNEELYNRLLKQADDFQQTRTGFTLHVVRYIDLHIFLYDPLRARGG